MGPTRNASRISLPTMAVWLALFGVAEPAGAHDGLHEQIERVSAEIRLHPQDPALYLRRGELHRFHKDWDSALADYERARRLDATLDEIDFVEGRMLREAGWVRAAAVVLERHLARHPERGQARLEQARALSQLERYAEAEDAYRAAFARLGRVRPDDVLERARSLAHWGDEHIAEALRVLDAGLTELGPLVVLQTEAMELEVRRGAIDAALERLDALLARAHRKETWLAMKARILAGAGRFDQADRAGREALRAIERLPQRYGQTPAMRTLRQSIRATLDRIASTRPALGPEAAGETAQPTKRPVPQTAIPPTEQPMETTP